VIGIVLAAALASPAPSPNWSAWKYVRRVGVPPRATTVSVVVPQTLYDDAAPDLRDVRVVDATGHAVPFAIVTPAPAPREAWRSATVTDAGFVRGSYTQAVADLGTNTQAYATLEIVTPLDAFNTTVDVDASDDRSTWRSVRVDAPIYDFAKDGLATNSQIAIPPSTARYVRVRVKQADAAFPIAGIRYAVGTNAQPERARYLVTAAPSKGGAGETLLDLSGLDSVPVDRLQVDARTLAYDRAAVVETSDDGIAWSQAGSTTLRRTATDSRDSIAFDETTAHRWRLRIADGDDAALSGVTVRAFGAPRRIVFDSSASGSYMLLYGNPRAEAPRYDYAATHGLTIAHAAEAPLGGQSANPGYADVDTRPFTDRYPWLIWGALIVAVAGIGALALRALK
jgi:hypothetical protein